jgi:hypothetical protein
MFENAGFPDVDEVSMIVSYHQSMCEFVVPMKTIILKGLHATTLSLCVHK